MSDMVTQLDAARRVAPRTAVVGIVLSLALGIGMGILRAANTEPALRGLAVAGNVAFAVVLAGPGMLAILGQRGRPSLLVAAGVLSLVFAGLLLISLVGLVFVPPAVLFFVAAGQLIGEPGSWPRAIAAVLVTVVLGTAAFFSLLVHEDPVCWARDAATGATYLSETGVSHDGGSISVTAPPGISESGCSSDTITTAEAIAAVAIVGFMLGAGRVLAGPPRRETPGGTPPSA